MVHGGNPILCPPLDRRLFGNAPFTPRPASALGLGDNGYLDPFLCGGGTNLREQLVGRRVVDRCPHEDVGRKHLFPVERSVPIIGGRDHGAVEKTGRLPAPLSLDGQPSGADPDVGDVGYYAPGQDLVLYYGDQSYFEGITVLGRMESGAATRISRMRGTVTVTVSASRP